MAIIEWLKQQSSQKAIIALIAAIGVQLDPDQVQTILSAFLALYAVIAGVRDKS